MDDGDSTEEKLLLKEHGQKVFDEYMALLKDNPDQFLMTGKCYKSAKALIVR